MEGLTPDQKLKLQEIFKAFDADGDGILTRDELVTALKGHVKRHQYDDAAVYNRVMNVIEEIVLIVDEEEGHIFPFIKYLSDKDCCTARSTSGRSRDVT